jgi:hypothetical protein
MTSKKLLTNHESASGDESDALLRDSESAGIKKQLSYFTAGAETNNAKQDEHNSDAQTWSARPIGHYAGGKAKHSSD